MIMPRCTVHCRHTVVRSSVGLSVCQILHISISGEVEVLKVGQCAKSEILIGKKFDTWFTFQDMTCMLTLKALGRGHKIILSIICTSCAI